MLLVGNHGSLSLLFMMMALAWHYVSDTHKVMATLILVTLVLALLEQADLQCVVVFSPKSHWYVSWEHPEHDNVNHTILWLVIWALCRFCQHFIEVFIDSEIKVACHVLWQWLQTNWSGYQQAVRCLLIPRPSSHHLGAAKTLYLPLLLRPLQVGILILC
jgi:hypothetical protein